MLLRFFKVLTVPFALAIYIILLFAGIVIGPVQYVIKGKGLDTYLSWVYRVSERYERWLEDVK